MQGKLHTKASIDLGTNSALLLIAKTDGRNFDVIREELRICRIGEGVDSTGNLNPKAIDRTIKVLEEYKKIAEECGVYNIIVGATSAVRDANNSDSFIKKVKVKLNIDIEIISAMREAELSFLSSLSTMPDNAKSALVIDIGGGSTEFIFGEDGNIKNIISHQLGSVRLTEEYLHHNPPKMNELSDVKKHIRRKLSSIEKEKWKGECFIGVAGTVTTVAQMIQENREYNRDKIDGFLIKQTEISFLIDKISKMSTEERKKLPGLHPDRADVIISGAIILKEIMEYFGYTETLTSTRGVRYGLMMEL